MRRSLLILGGMINWLILFVALFHLFVAAFAHTPWMQYFFGAEAADLVSAQWQRFFDFQYYQVTLVGLLLFQVLVLWQFFRRPRKRASVLSLTRDGDTVAITVSALEDLLTRAVREINDVVSAQVKIERRAKANSLLLLAQVKLEQSREVQTVQSMVNRVMRETLEQVFPTSLDIHCETRAIKLQPTHQNLAVPTAEKNEPANFPRYPIES